MNKKPLSLFLSLLLSAPCLFALNACDDSNTPPPSTNEVTEAQWKAALSSIDSLKLQTRKTYEEEQYEDEKKPEQNNTYVVSKYHSVLFHKGDFEVQSGQNEVVFYTTETNGDTISYYKRAEANGFEKEPAEESEFIYTQAFFDTFTKLLVNRYADFTFTEGLNNDTYVLNTFSADFDVVEETLTAYFGQDFDLKEIELEFHSGVVTDIGFKNNTQYNANEAGQLDFMLSPCEGVLAYHLKTMFDSLTNYTIEGGEGVNYSKFEFTENMFHLYMPNVEDATQREMFWHKDESGASPKYVLYTKNESGNWIKDDTKTEAEYNNGRGNIAEMFFLNLAKSVTERPSPERPLFEYRNGAYYLNHYAEGTDYMRYVYRQAFIRVDENHQITSATYQFRNEGHLVGEPVEYDLTLTANATTITLPTV